MSTELAWAAGFYDGEGSMGFYDSNGKGRWKRIVLSVTQVDRSPLDRFKLAVGGLGVVDGPFKRKNPNANLLHRYNAYSLQDIHVIISAMWPYLCKPKQLQADKAISAYLEYSDELYTAKQFCNRGHSNWTYYGDRRECKDCRFAIRQRYYLSKLRAA
jgi:hypothetical protein